MNIGEYGKRLKIGLVFFFVEPIVAVLDGV